MGLDSSLPVPNRSGSTLTQSEMAISKENSGALNTLSSLPQPRNHLGEIAYTSDFGLVVSNGTAWVSIGGASSASYLGQIATGVRIPQDLGLSATAQGMSRTGHYMRENVTSFQVVWPNFYLLTTGSGETATGTHNANIQASVEYPVGIFTQITFGGSINGQIPPGSMLTSDAITTPVIPKGALFFIRCYFTSQDAIIYSTQALNGSGYSSGSSGIANTVMGGGNPTSSFTAYAPIAIIGQTARPAIMMLGDSRLAGIGETFNSAFYYKGELERILAPQYAVMNLGASADRAQGAATSFANRNILAQYCTHIISEYGINDIIHGRTSAQMLADLQTMFANTNLVNKPIYQSTLAPVSTSTDGWTTEGNQTTDATNSVRNTANAAIRNTLPNTSGVIDYDLSFQESLTVTGVWQAPQGTAITSDGIHMNTTGVQRTVAQNLGIAGLFSVR